MSIWNGLRDRGLAGVQEDFDVHASICRASHNRFFVESLNHHRENICTGMNLSRNMSLQRPNERAKAVQSEHADIVAAVIAGDSAAAQGAMRRHISNARVRVFDGVGQSDDAQVL
jgi:DNA-binding FadR family transcriptional regulator